MEKVSGGAVDDLKGNDVTCEACGKHFNCEAEEKREVSEGCHSFTIYKCPNCKRWVQFSGRLYE